MTDLDYATGIVVLIVAALVTGASIAVIKLHARALAATPSARGLLSWHIVSIAASVVGVWATLALAQFDTLALWHTPRALRLAMYATFGVLTLISLYIIAREQRLRVTRTPTKTTVVEERETIVQEP